jgi:hypothetical protein
VAILSIGYNLGMAAVTDTPVAMLVVTGPLRERLYELFRSLYAGRGDVLVVEDRRIIERRSTRGALAVDRRRDERRRSDPWLVFPPG